MTNDRRQLAAIMLTDMVGYTALTQADEALSLALLEEHCGLLRPIFDAHEGREIKCTGDGFLVEFPSALQAVRCGTDIQKVFHERNESQPLERKIQLRIGIHLGDIVHRGDDIFGDGVNIAARIEPLAPPGGLCISRQVYDQVANKTKFEFVSLGPRSLKHIARPVEVFRVTQPWEGNSLERSEKRPAQRSRRESVAVLPFANMSSDAENEYFSDGLTEDILAQLSKISALKVISRTSVMRYKKTDKSLREIAAELGVATIVEGSARRDANRVRIVAQLIDAETDEHLWAETYDRDLTDIFAIQSDVAGRIAQSLHARITEPESARLKRQPTRNMEAYGLYLRARNHWNRRTERDLRQAVDCYQEAIDLAPGYASAYAGLANAFYLLVQHEYEAAAKFIPKAEEAALRAVQLDDTLSEAHASLGAIAQYRLDWQRAEREFTRAIELDASNATPREFYAIDLAAQARFEEAVEQIRWARELDPHSIVIQKNACFIRYLMRQYDLALEELSRLLKLDAELILDAHLTLGLVLLQLGKYVEAETEFKLYGRSPDNVLTLECEAAVLVALAQHLQGQEDKLRETLSYWEADPDRSRRSIWAMAGGCFHLGESDRGYDLLEEAYDTQRESLRYLKVAPYFDIARGDVRFAQILARLGLSEAT